MCRIIRQGRFFFSFKLIIVYFFAFLIQLLFRDKYSMKRTSAVDWFSFCHEVSAETLLWEMEEEKQMGEGIIVEVEDSEFAKCKYGKTCYYVGMHFLWERENAKNCFLVEVPDSSTDTLIQLRQKHKAPRSMMYSYCWNGCSHLGELSSTHVMVNRCDIQGS